MVLVSEPAKNVIIMELTVQGHGDLSGNDQAGELLSIYYIYIYLITRKQKTPTYLPGFHIIPDLINALLAE